MEDHKKLAIVIRDMFDFTGIPMSIKELSLDAIEIVIHTALYRHNTVSVLVGRIQVYNKRIDGIEVTITSPFAPVRQTVDIRNPDSLKMIRRIVEEYYYEAVIDLREQCKADRTIYAKAYWFTLVAVLLLVITSFVYHRGVGWILPLYAASACAVLTIPSYFYAFGGIPRHRL
jgi:hypothetical protein